MAARNIKAESPAAKPADGTATLDKALDVLDAIGASGRGLSQAELSERLAVPRTTLYRLLGTLVERGMLRRDPLRRVYCLGFRCFEYARTAYAMPDLVAAASMELRSLRDLTGETTYLAVLDGLESLSLERVDGAHSQRSSAALGQRKPLHCTSQGKAMLSALDPQRRDALVREMTLTAVTPHSITDRRRLQAELRVTAARGYAIDDEEIVPGVRCCGAPIVDAAGQVRGAISVAAPVYRMTRERVELVGPEVAQAARRIGAQLQASQVRSGGEAPAVVVDGPIAFHGAFPFWSAAEKRLYWADTLAPAVHRADTTLDRCVVELESPVLAMLGLERGVLVQQHDGWIELGPDGTARRTKLLPRRQLAALSVAPDGQAWACVRDGDNWRMGALKADGEVLGGWRLPEAVTASAWKADGSALYAIAPESGTVFLLSRGTATLRRLASVSKGSGSLSGLALDRDGGVWTALKDGWSVARLAPDGALDRVVSLPVPYPSALAFCGSTLFVTSARESLAMEALASAPLSGRLFRIELDVVGEVQAFLPSPSGRG